MVNVWLQKILFFAKIDFCRRKSRQIHFQRLELYKNPLCGIYLGEIKAGIVSLIRTFTHINYKESAMADIIAI
jgi:hypothetical protein